MNNSFERPFGMLMLPSNGLFYKNNNKFLFINHLTYYEENILTSEMMQEGNLAMPMILNKVIASEDFDVKEILSCDVQAISMFLRAYSYGNNIEIDIKCPHCLKEDKHTITISNFKSKDIDVVPGENGEISLITPKYNKQLKIKPKSYIQEMEFKKHKERKQSEILCFYIEEFEGERDKDKILKMLSILKIMESRDIKKTVFDNLPGINTSIVYNCDFCEKDTTIDFGDNGADFLKLPASFMANVLEEIFLLVHYGKGFTDEGVKKMPVGERRFFINRLSEEITKKKEAEEGAARSAKSKSKR